MRSRTLFALGVMVVFALMVFGGFSGYQALTVAVGMAVGAFMRDALVEIYGGSHANDKRS